MCVESAPGLAFDLAFPADCPTSLGAAERCRELPVAPPKSAALESVQREIYRLHTSPAYGDSMRRVLCLGLALVALIPGSAQAKPSPLPGVVTPSGNIRCFYVPARPCTCCCDIHRAAYSQREQNSCMARSGLD